MVEDSVLKEMESKWAKYGYVYQGKDRSGLKLEHFEKHSCPLLAGKDVLEFACNAGIFGYLISQYANSYIGVEPGKLIKEEKHPNIDYFAQAQITKEYIKNPNVKFINDRVDGFLSREASENYNALVVCFALYHFSDSEISKIEKIVFPKCDTVIIQNRNKKRDKRKNSHDLFSNKNIVEWLSKFGYKCKVLDFNNGKYSEIQGIKE